MQESSDWYDENNNNYDDCDNDDDVAANIINVSDGGYWLNKNFAASQL